MGLNGAGVLLGAHLSISGGYHKAVAEARQLGCTALQIFTKNAHTWAERVVRDSERERFLAARSDAGVDVILSHTAYLLNLASDKPDVRARSEDALEQELVRCDRLEIPFLVHHPGAHMGKGVTHGLAMAADAINRVFERLPTSRARLLLETCAGQGTGLGHRFDHFKVLIDNVADKDRIGVCLDTCHMFAAGYDIRTPDAYQRTLDQFDVAVGLDTISAIHLNDSKRELGARVDRHAHIGEGAIGMDAFRFIMNDQRFAAVPKIIETPRRPGDDGRDDLNLTLLRGLVDRSGACP